MKNFDIKQVSPFVMLLVPAMVFVVLLLLNPIEAQANNLLNGSLSGLKVPGFGGVVKTLFCMR